jgi:hypothetical protein
MILICPVVIVFLLGRDKGGIVANGMEDVKKRSVRTDFSGTSLFFDELGQTWRQEPAAT